MGLKIIINKKQPALIIVHRKQLMEQWMERIEAFLKIPKSKIGKIAHGKIKIGQQITLAMIQTLGKKIDSQEIINTFKTILIDECHHVPADSYSSTIAKLCPYYQYGLTATPYRKHNLGKLIFAHLGETIAEIKPQNIETYKRTKIVIRNTDFNVPFNSKTDQFEVLSKILIHDISRNKRIVMDISGELNRGRKVIVITERKEHITALNQFLKQTYEVITLSGDDSANNQKLKWKSLNAGNYQVLITTGQFFGEGSDLQTANCLFLVYPFAFKGKLIQYIGRVQRSETKPIIYDYRDQGIDYLNKMFLKRNKHYRHFDKQATLFDDPNDLLIEELNGIITIDKKIKIRFEDLDFRYGSISFNYHHKSNSQDLNFNIENDFIRPEFDILKPYFSKRIGTKSVNINIFAEFQNNLLVSQSATSKDLDKINKEIIESVRFSFVEQRFFGNKTLKSNTNDKQHPIPSLYQSNSALLEDVLLNRNVKHFRQLRYLSNSHCSSLVKLRYVLHPFSFVFLLSGKNHFHVVLETLDTEEATYLWHFEKNNSTLISNLSKVDKDLNTIRIDGRQLFLKNQPSNFSRIIHDYSDERKGFVI